MSHLFQFLLGSKSCWRLADLGEHVRLAQDEQVLAVDRDLGAAVLGVEDLVALGDVERAALAVLVDRAVADGEDLALLRLLLGGVGEDDAARGRLLLLDRLARSAGRRGASASCADLRELDLLPGLAL